MKPSDQHLTDDQFENFLIGESAPPVAAHVAACPHCCAKYEAFQSVLTDFNQSTLDWAHSRIAPSTRLQRPSAAPERRWFSTSAYAFAAAILVLVTFFAWFTSQHRHGTEVSRTASSTFQPAADSSNAGQPAQDPQVAADNNLMAEIDSALDQPDPVPTAGPRLVLTSRNVTADATRSSAR
jgi:hypothetical protein